MARPRSDIRPRILRAARDRFLADGVDGASLRGIAEDAGTNIGMIYYYFPAKDDLFLAVVEDVYTGVLGDLERALEPTLPPRARIERMYARIGALSDEELKIVRLVFRELLLFSPRMEKVLERFQRGHLPLVLAALRDGAAEGTVDPDQHPVLLLLTTFAVGALPQLMLRFLGDRSFAAGAPSGPDLAPHLVRFLFHGIGPRSGNA